MHTVSLELSKKLKEAGYEQEGEWYYSLILDAKEASLMMKKDTKSFKTWGRIQDGGIVRYFVAPTLGELIRKMPIDGQYIVHQAADDIWHCERRYHNTPMRRSNTPEDACAKMWIYLKQEGLI